MRKVEGGCLCGAVRIVATGEPDRVGICHCLDCRKHHGAVFYAAAIYPANQVAISGDTGEYRHRHFCRDCGSSVFARWEDEIEVHLGTLDEGGQFAPGHELWTIRREPWLPGFPDTELHDRNRPRYPDECKPSLS